MALPTFEQMLHHLYPDNAQRVEMELNQNPQYRSTQVARVMRGLPTSDAFLPWHVFSDRVGDIRYEIGENEEREAQDFALVHNLPVEEVQEDVWNL